MTSPGGGSLGALYVDVRPGTSRFGSELTQQTIVAGNRAADAAGPGMGRRLAGHIGKALAVGTGVLAVALTRGLAKSVKEASDLNETITKTQTVFGKSGAAVIKWSQGTSKSLGQSQKATLDAASTFAIYGKAAGKTGKENVAFSTGLVKLASDMASFSNTSPEEAINALGSALRGENDPIEKYGVLLQDTTLKNTALKMGIIKTTEDALTPQQRVLVVQAELFKQLGDRGSKTMGDFARTQAGLANQQRIAKAEVTNLSATIGASLLPVATRAVVLFNTKMIPAFRQLWVTHGPQIVAFLTTAADRFGAWVSTIDRADIAGWANRARAAFVAATPVVTEFVKNFKQGGADSLGDSIKVTGVAMQYLADHADLLAKALPYLVAGLVAYKVSQLAANVAAVVAPIATFANAVATRQLAASNTALAASNVARTGTTVAATAATTGGTVATGAASIATRALGVAVRFAMGPLGIIITVLSLVAAGVVYLYKNNETARKVIDTAWKYIKIAIKAVGDWITGTLWPSLKKAYAQGETAVKFLVAVWKFQFNLAKTIVSTVVSFVINTFMKVKNFITVTLPNAFRTGVNMIRTVWDMLKETAAKPVRFVINTVFNGIGGIFNKIAGFLHLPESVRFPTVKANFATGGHYDGQLPGRPSAVDNMLGMGPGGKPVALASGEFIVNAAQTRKNLPVLHAINNGMDGYADGGLLGFIRNPASWVKDKVGGTIGRIRGLAGDSLIGRMLVGLSDRVRDGVVSRAKSFIGGMFGGGGNGGQFGKWPSSPGASRGDSGVWRAIVALIRSTGPMSGAFGNAYRPGDPKWHGSGRAVDWMGFNQDRLASYLAALKPLELIHRTGSRDYAYTRGVNKGSFNNSLMEAHRNHIHIAMARGGLLRSFDNGGLWPTGTVGVNTSGRTETVSSGQTMDDAVEALWAILTVLQRLAPELAAAMVGMVGRSAQYARQYGSPLKVKTA